LDAGDRAGSLPVVVVSEELVRQAWPDGEAIGRRVRRLRAGVAGPWMTVVGVVADVKEDRFGFRIDRPVWYVPYAQEAFPLPVAMPLSLVVRPAPGVAVAAALRQAIHGVDFEQPVAAIMPMREYLADVLVGERFGAGLMGTLASLGLLLAALGLYGLMAYAVGQRGRELALRLALGARPADLLWLVIADSMVVVAAGLAVGGAGGWALARLLASTLYGVRPADPATFAAVAVVLAATALLACALPARRAARLAPQSVLKEG
ncbi:MAG TPA: FtsX-like permease family protein, partial [Thermoanaerobaculia bacterium]|nr:FtsX-like permease family protein [Thermoanaerobaculia bacterium]